MKIQNKCLCKLGPSSRGFYIENTYLTDKQIGKHFDLFIEPAVHSEDNTESIKQKLLDLMNLHPDKTWLIQEFAGKATKWLNLGYYDAKKYIERLLPSIQEITRVSETEYRRSRAPND